MLTDDMTRLRGSILALRNMRSTMMNELEQGNRTRKRAVSDLCRHFHSARASMARRTKAERMTRLQNLKQVVNAHRQSMQSDLTGARKIWARGSV
jgi:hypothetical protein